MNITVPTAIINGIEFDDVEFAVDLSGGVIAGRYGDAWENCYPDEGEYTIDLIELDDELINDETGEVIENVNISDEDMKNIEDWIYGDSESMDALIRDMGEI